MFGGGGGGGGGSSAAAPAADETPKLEDSDKSINFIFSGEFPGLNDVQATFLTAGDVPMAEPSQPVQDAGAYSFERDWQRNQIDDTAAIVLKQNRGGDDSDDEAKGKGSQKKRGGLASRFFGKGLGSADADEEDED